MYYPLDSVEQQIIWCAMQQRVCIEEKPLTHRASRKQRRHVLKIMQTCDIHPAAAAEIWAAPQFGNTALARRALRLFRSAEPTAQWRRRALSVLAELRWRRMPATALELFQWIILYDASITPDVGMQCFSCIDTADRHHNVSPLSLHLWRSNRVAVLATIWQHRYPHVLAALSVAERSLSEFEMLAEFEAEHPQFFDVVLTATEAYFDGMRLPDDLQQYGIAAGELLLSAAKQVCTATADEIRYPNPPLAQLLLHWAVQLLDQLDISDTRDLLQFWHHLNGGAANPFARR